MVIILHVQPQMNRAMTHSNRNQTLEYSRHHLKAIAKMMTWKLHPPSELKGLKIQMIPRLTDRSFHNKNSKNHVTCKDVTCKDVTWS